MTNVLCLWWPRNAQCTTQIDWNNAFDETINQTKHKLPSVELHVLPIKYEMHENMSCTNRYPRNSDVEGGKM